MSSLQTLPVELFLDNLLPVLPLKDLLSVTCINRFFATLCSEDLFWKRKLKDDYNFDGTASARTSGWKIIYRGITRPELYVWGDHSQGRLGTHKYNLVAGGAPTPTRLRIPGASQIVSLAAGGWSFHALDSRGHIYVWGQLDDGYSSPSSGFNDRSKRASTPARLQLPDEVYITSLKCTRRFAVALDSRYRVWMFISWGRPFIFNSPLLTQNTASIVQVENGWGFCASLNSAGEVYIWWPGSGQMADTYGSKMRELDQLNDEAHNGMLRDDGAIQCFPWTMDDVDPFPTPPIPSDLPPLKKDGKANWDCKLVKIAAGDRFIIGLTDGGHVLALDFPDDHHNMGHVRWQYLPYFCDVNAIRELQSFEKKGMTCPNSIDITHISAHFHTFVAYSTGESAHVLMATTEAVSSSTPPTIIPSLQRGIVSLHLGDYHFGALTTDGKLLTWGKYCRGALGLGDPREIPTGEPGGYANEDWKQRRELLPTPPDVEVPSEVKFGKKGGKKFCFAASAAGWHFGALVIDMQPEVGEDDGSSDTDTDDEGRARKQETDVRMRPLRGGILGRGRGTGWLQGHAMDMDQPVFPPFGYARVGFAGRGMNRGRGGGGRGRGQMGGEA